MFRPIPFTTYPAPLAGIALTLAALSALTALPAHADDARFTANVNSTCQLVITDGTLVPRAALTELTSEATSGGTPAAVVATANTTGFSVSITAPSAFTDQPAAYTASTSFVAALSPDLDSNSTSEALILGANALTVDLTATAAGGNTFAPGTYEAIVDVTCS